MLSAYAAELKICAGIIFIATLLRLFNSFFKAIKRINTANFLDMLFNKGWVLLLLASFLLIGKFTVKNVFQLWLLGAAIAFAAAVYSLRKEIVQYLRLNARFYAVKKSLYFSIPLILVIVSNWFLSMSNRYILNFYTTTAIVGVFALAFSLMGVITTFSTTVSQVIQPYFTEAFMKKEKQDVLINTSLKYGLILVVPAMVASIVWRKKIILLIATGEYLGAKPLFVLLSHYPLYALIAFVFYQVLIAADRTKYVGAMHLIAALLSVGINFALIPLYGMKGAAIATLVSYGFLAAAMAVPALKHVKIYRNYLKVEKILLASAILGAFMFAFDFVWSLAGEIALFAAAAVIYPLLVLALKIIDKKEVLIIKKITPRFFHPVFDYFVK
ncbi:MAG: polysaccharide biosynthesis protein [Candidatus Aenigmarchaeota archaeon]|nr:polysaccharide biosynthesis protein [Candidatus Aenigmarchaeota archaeon]